MCLIYLYLVYYDLRSDSFWYSFIYALMYVKRFFTEVCYSVNIQFSMMWYISLKFSRHYAVSLFLFSFWVRAFDQGIWRKFSCERKGWSRINMRRNKILLLTWNKTWYTQYIKKLLYKIRTFIYTKMFRQLALGSAFSSVLGLSKFINLIYCMWQVKQAFFL